MDEQEKQVKNEKKAKQQSDKPGITQRIRIFFTDLRGEGRKIIWPDRKELQKKTVTVIFTSLLFAVIIFGIDTIYNVILQLFVGLLSA